MDMDTTHVLACMKETRELRIKPKLLAQSCVFLDNPPHHRPLHASDFAENLRQVRRLLLHQCLRVVVASLLQCCGMRRECFVDSREPVGDGHVFEAGTALRA